MLPTPATLPTSRPDIWNAVREVSRRMTGCDDNHMKALLRLMKHCVDTKNRGWTLKPNMKWDGISKTFEVEVDGDADSNYATHVDTRKSVT